MEYKVSVIIPIFGVERFIGKCAHSLMEQSLKEVEFIFVNDATKDHSVEILSSVLSEYPERQDHVKLLSHPKNLGLPSARNTGLREAKGKYVLHCDSDDYMEKDMIESLYVAAEENNSDIAYCDFWLTFEKNERLIVNPSYNDAYTMLKDGFLSGKMKFNVWNKLIKLELFRNTAALFPDGYAMGEDMTIICIVACAKKVVWVPRPLYHYVKINSNAYSNDISEKRVKEIIYNVERVSKYVREKYGNQLEKELSFFKLCNKLPFIISDESSHYETWKQLWPETNCYIMKNVNQPYRTRLLQFAASKGWFPVIKLYYKFVFKFIYGVLYR